MGGSSAAVKHHRRRNCSGDSQSHSSQNYDAIKTAHLAGYRSLSGGFDMPRVTAILARELGIDPLQVSKKGAGSEFLSRPTKMVEVQDA